MNKKIVNLVLAAALTVTSMGVASAKKTEFGNAGGGGNGISTNTSVSKKKFFKKLASAFAQFNTAVTSADTACGNRISSVAAAELGVSKTTIESDFFTSGFSSSQYYMAQIISSSAGVPVNDVLEQVRLNRSFLDIVRQFRVDNNTTLSLFNTFTLVINNEVAIANGTFQPNIALYQADFNRAVVDVGQFYDRIASVRGQAAADTFLYQRLAITTGLSLDQIRDLRTSLPTTVTASDFSVALITANSIAASSGNAFNFEGDLLTSAGIFTNLDTNAIQLPLVTTRLNLFGRGLRSGAGM